MSKIFVRKTPAHPKVEPVEKSRPTKVYLLAVEDDKDYPTYQKLWRENFQIRRSCYRRADLES